MYKKAYGIIETLAPLHVGASAGEETGNLNLIFRDQFTQTGIIPGSSIRGRFRADLRLVDPVAEARWYGHPAVAGQSDGGTTEALIKFEYASLVWLPVFCPGQPVVWVTCPRLLERYRKVVGLSKDIKTPKPYTAAKSLAARPVTVGKKETKVLFFSLGFLTIDHHWDAQRLQPWIPDDTEIDPAQVVVVGNNDIGLLHDQALYRQSRVALDEKEKKAKQTAFFNVEALPEGSVLAFPVAAKIGGWRPFGEDVAAPYQQELYFGGLESIGFGRCQVTLASVPPAKQDETAYFQLPDPSPATEQAAA